MTTLYDIQDNLVIRRRLPDGDVELKVERAEKPSASFFRHGAEFL